MSAICNDCGKPAAMLFDGACIDCRFDHEHDDQPEMSEDEEFLEYHCGWMPGGGCLMAGSEDCDWSCPRTRQQVRTRIERMKAKEKPLPLFTSPTERQDDE